jgi:hypothetical protein
LLSLSVFSQTFSIYSDEQATSSIFNNDTITVNADSAGQVTFDFFGYIKNNTPTSLNLHIEIQKVYVSEDNLVQLCFGGVCYTTLYCDGSVDASAIGELHITLYYTADDTAANIIKVTVTDASKGDTSVFFVKYQPQKTSANLLTSSQAIYFSKPFPNPADAFVKFSYKLPETKRGTLTIYSILGDKIEMKNIISGKEYISINTSTYKTGYYIYILEIDNKKVLTDRFLVRH